MQCAFRGQIVYYTRETATIKSSSDLSCKIQSATSSCISWLLLIKQLFHSHLLNMDDFIQRTDFYVERSVIEEMLDLNVGV